MQSTKQMLFAAAVAAVCTLNAGVRGAEPVRPTPAATNKALAASPRYLEEHPELLRAPPSAQEAHAKAARTRRRLAKLIETRAVANGPRFLEENPELLRPPISAEEAQAKFTRIARQQARLEENRAWTASPRVREEFPWLARGVAP